MASDELAEFFESAGAIGLFCVINPAGSRFGELREELVVAKSTVTTRLSEAEKLGLVSKERVSDGDDVMGLWVPTERGMEVYEELRARRLPKRHDEYSTVVREYRRERGAFKEYVERRDDEYWSSLSDEFEQRQE